MADVFVGTVAEPSNPGSSRGSGPSTAGKQHGNFDPVNWLDRFNAAGGWWLIGADEKLTIGWHLLDAPADQPERAREVYRELQEDPSRRSAVKRTILAGDVPACEPTPLPTPKTDGDAALHAAWVKYCSARDALDSLPIDADESNRDAVEAPHWAACEAAEIAALTAQAMTPGGVAIKLKFALVRDLVLRADDAAIRRSDMAFLVNAGLEWQSQMLVSAIRSLEGMGE